MYAVNILYVCVSYRAHVQLKNSLLMLSSWLNNFGKKTTLVVWRAISVAIVVMSLLNYIPVLQIWLE